MSSLGSVIQRPPRRRPRGVHLRAATLLVVLAVVAGGCAGDDGSTDDEAVSTTTSALPVTTEPGYESSFTEGACPPVVPPDDRVSCGVLVVPEDRRKPDGRVVRLAVARIAPPSAASDRPPLLWLTGGPGSPSLRDVQWQLDVPLVEDRELVLVDLRGTGESEPSLACPEVQDDLDAWLALVPDAGQRAEIRDALEVCRARLTGLGIDLEAFDYTAMAADLDDLRRALDVEEWDVYGISNGGRLALEYLRRHPDGIRSLVLDAALPPQGNFYRELWPHGASAIDRLFAACAADAGCDAAYPGLEADAWAVVDRLGREPVVRSGVNEPTGRTVDVVLDGRAALELLRVALYDHGLIPVIPQIVHDLAAGSDEAYDLVVGYLLAGASTSDVFSLGEQLSVNCREEMAFLDRETFVEQAAELPRYADVILQPGDDELCEIWDVGKADASVDEPVESDVPALVLVGELDPVHPRASAEAIVENLPNARLYELPGLGHGVAKAHPCPTSLVRAFLADPSGRIDADCVDEMPEPMWVLPEPLDG